MELEGKPLSFWLQELICEGSERRDLAAPLLSRFDDEFKEAVQATLSEPDFPRIEWMNQLIDFLSWMSEELRRVTLVDFNPEQIKVLGNQNFAGHRVFDASGKHLLDLPERLFEALERKGLRGTVETLLSAVAEDVPEELMAELWERWQGRGMLRVDTLATLIQHRPHYIERVGRLLGEDERAVYVLRYVGPVAAQIVPECVPTLLTWLENGHRQGEAIPALSTLTCGQEIAVEPLLKLSYSDDIWVKGAALEALGRIARCPEKVVPRLIAAFDDYQEPDSDAYWHSEHLVVTQALCAFGPAAAPAIPALMARLKTGDTIDPWVWRCLESIGEPVLPWLEELERYVDEEELADTTLEEAEATGNGFVCEATVLRLRQLRDKSTT